MIVNESKTALMCFSAAKSFRAEAKLTLAGSEIKSTNTVKLLGVTLNSRCNFHHHAISVKNKIRAKSWALAKLRRAGMKTDQLIRTYKNLVRPAAEYVVPVWHSMLTAAQADLIERQQCQALKNIFGAGISASKLRSMANVRPLSARRRNACLKFAQKFLESDKFNKWFLKRLPANYVRRSNIEYNTFNEPNARADRYRNSPKVYLTRLLNSNH